jgi:hypothetical protein
MQATTTAISVLAALMLLTHPRKRWLLVTIPVVVFLSLVQRTVWTHFP